MDSIPLTDYVGKKVKFTLAATADKPVEELEGTVDIVAPDGSALVIKEKGHTMTRLIESSAIAPGSLALIQEKPRELKAKRLDVLTLANARQHLLDRHEYHLKRINEMNDEDALREHGQIDHDHIGHFHAAREAAETVEVAAEPELVNA